jgi:predicted nucleic acid-binding protein
MDDMDGRAEAERRNLKVTGTLGILVEAHRRQLLDFDGALARLSKTSFYLSPRLIETVRRLL